MSTYQNDAAVKVEGSGNGDGKQTIGGDGEAINIDGNNKDQYQYTKVTDKIKKENIDNKILVAVIVVLAVEEKEQQRANPLLIMIMGSRTSYTTHSTPMM